jgi:signal peptidase I
MDNPNQNPNSRSNKEPWLAANLSLILPGIGQIYAGKSIKGYIILSTFTLLAIVGGWTIVSPTGNSVIGIGILTLSSILLPIWNLFDAYYSARSKNSTEFESLRKQSKDVWLAIFLSAYIPGLGHAYLGKWLYSIALVIIFLLIPFLSISAPDLIGIILRVLLGLVAFYHVYISAPVRRERTSKIILLFLSGFLGGSVILSGVIALGIRQFIAEARYIPSEAMRPTLQVNDRLIINKLTYRFREPERGDIIVFSPTETLKKQNFRDAFIKRIVGIPGDRIEITEGRVYLNGQLLDEDYIAKEDTRGNGLDAQVIPPNSYIVLGDFRSNSYDSRFWGLVPRENIIGIATKRFYPFDRAGSLIAK